MPVSTEPPSPRSRRWWRQALEGEAAPGGAWIGITISVLVVASVVALMVETLPDLGPAARLWLDRFEVAVVTLFAVEFLARLWLAGDPQVGGWRARLRWALSPGVLLDAVAVAAGVYALTGAQVDATRMLRMARVLRLFRLTRYTQGLATLGRVVVAKRGELVVVTMVVAMLLLMFAVAIYHAENAVQPERFASAFDGLWWSVITMTTIGYGDVYPMTVPGRIIGGCAALLGVGLITLPAGIIATGFLEELKGKDREKRDGVAVASARCPHCGKGLGDHAGHPGAGDGATAG
ncbi:MAG TPA: ion transporter [Planctomycetota bacterium]|nr:ion transporter [Planctomycetota bacterium]